MIVGILFILSGLITAYGVYISSRNLDLYTFENSKFSEFCYDLHIIVSGIIVPFILIIFGIMFIRSRAPQDIVNPSKQVYQEYIKQINIQVITNNNDTLQGSAESWKLQ